MLLIYLTMPEVQEQELFLLQQARQKGHVPFLHRAVELGESQPVDLDHDQAGFGVRRFGFWKV